MHWIVIGILIGIGIMLAPLILGLAINILVWLLPLAGYAVFAVLLMLAVKNGIDPGMEVMQGLGLVLIAAPIVLLAYLKHVEAKARERSKDEAKKVQAARAAEWEQQEIFEHERASFYNELYGDQTAAQDHWVAGIGRGLRKAEQQAAYETYKKRVALIEATIERTGLCNSLPAFNVLKNEYRKRRDELPLL